MKNSFNEKISDYKEGSLSLKNLLLLLPDETIREYEKDILGLIGIEPHILSKAKRELEDTDNPKKVRYAAFFCLCTYFRRNLDCSKYGELIDSYFVEFKDNPTYDFLKSMYLKATRNEYNIKEAIVLSEETVKRIPSNVGVIHNYCDIIATAFEEGYLDAQRDDEHLKKALHLSNKAIELSPDYAKFYSTLGRLQFINNEYKSAREQLFKAIDKEDSGEKDYALRIMEYQKILIRIDSNFYINKLNDKYNEQNNAIETARKEIKESLQSSKEIKESVQNSLVKNIEFLGFFAAIVSFIIASIQLAATKQNVQDSARLILLLCGCLITAFSSFSIVFTGMKLIKRKIVMMSLGIGIIIVSLSFFSKLIR